MLIHPPMTIEEFEKKNHTDRMKFLDLRLKSPRVRSPLPGRPLPVRIHDTNDGRRRANRGNGHY